MSASLVCCNDGMDSSHDSVGIDVPESLLSRGKERSPSCTTIAGSPSISQRAVFEIAISDRPGLGRISKRGDGYQRTLLIHGARSTLLRARKQQPDRLREWAHKLAPNHVHNKAAVAVANKVARIVWAVWSPGETYGRDQRVA